MRTALIGAAALLGVSLLMSSVIASEPQNSMLDAELRAALATVGFTGQIESTLEHRLGRPVDRRLAELGQLLFFDKIAALRGDNACAGCHSPTAGFGDTQSIAIGIQNNN